MLTRNVIKIGIILQWLTIHPKAVTRSAEQRLFHDLFEGYAVSVRPVLNSSHSVTVRLGITLTMVHDVDEKNQVITSNVWLDQSWHDERLIWNPDDYEGLTNVRIPCSKIWLPDIVLYNSVDDHSNGYHRALAWLYSDGKVFWPPIVRMRSSCKLDISFFPFDDQICNLKLGSWAYDGFQLDVVKLHDRIDLENFIDNGEWSLLSTAVVRNVVVYNCCIEPYPDIMFYLHMRRRNLYYTFNVIIPCIILSSLTLVGFLLPSDSGEKVTLGLTVLLAYSVFMLLIAENMPPTSEFAPLVGIYLTVVMLLTSLSVAFSVLVLNLHHRKTESRPPRKFMNFFINHAIRFLCISPPNFPDYPSTETPSKVCDEESASKKYNGRPLELRRSVIKMTRQPLKPYNSHFPLLDHSRCIDTMLVNGSSAPHSPIYLSRRREPASGADSELEEEYERPTSPFPITTRISPQETPKHVESGDTAEQTTILSHLRNLVIKQENMEAEAVKINEWHFAALVTDRLLCFIFLVVTFLSTLSLLVFQPMRKNLKLNVPPDNKTFFGFQKINETDGT